ncbi:MAG TPA: type IV toxin-antitoxin system AbiEi family antitoxin domain-containing protein, partial [Solirubrobacterales bacterium]|nr:type IV toxin-antitoxin system AbiEi family antitoxin domain-containing protein [Solirubrobacterales bacterium]
YGVVSIKQLCGPLGYSRGAVARAVNAGRLHRLHRGVFAVGHKRIPPHGECLAAVLAAGPRSLLSHLSAAWLWGVSGASPAPFSVTTPVHRKPRPPICLHEARALTAEDRVLREGIPVTSLSRTLLDVAAAVRFEWLERMVERSEELGLFDLRAVEELLARTVGHHGHARLRKAIALYKPTSFTRSSLERRFLELVVAAGLPQPRTNYVEHGFELDCYWPELRFAVELDLFETHGTRAAFERDRKRQEDLLLSGMAMTRVTGPRLEREPEEVINRIRRLLEQRQESQSLSP